MHAADDGTRLEPVAHDRARQLIEAGSQLEIDVQADAGRFVHEERKGIVEGRQLRGKRAQRVEREVAHPAARGSVAHLVEMIRMGEHERASSEIEDVELDQVDARSRPPLGTSAGCSRERERQHRGGRSAARRRWSVKFDHGAPCDTGRSAQPAAGEESNNDCLENDDRGREPRSVLPEDLGIRRQGIGQAGRFHDALTPHRRLSSQRPKRR